MKYQSLAQLTRSGSLMPLCNSSALDMKAQPAEADCSGHALPASDLHRSEALDLDGVLGDLQDFKNKLVIQFP